MSAGVLAVIPARLGSTRLPRKPLHRIGGRPLIEWVWRRVSDAAIFESIVVATDSPEIRDTVVGFGGRCMLTDPGHASGTDRVAEVARAPRYAGYDVIVNVQGDEPFVRTNDLLAATELVAESGWPVGTVAAPIESAAELGDPAVVKVVRDDAGGALYFSRAAVPFVRDGDTGSAIADGDAFYRHVGLYVYRRTALLRWVELPEGRLERLERLEQLRPLAAGIRIGVAIVEPGEGGIDTPADAARAERLLRTNQDPELVVATRS
jgi:3-deoxy-manno-octulosonate cytidylyltransferase (CMP-KDO synthetase)